MGVRADFGGPARSHSGVAPARGGARESSGRCMDVRKERGGFEQLRAVLGCFAYSGGGKWFHSHNRWGAENVGGGTFALLDELGERARWSVRHVGLSPQIIKISNRRGGVDTA